jgi:hypothetical protein
MVSGSCRFTSAITSRSALQPTNPPLQLELKDLSQTMKQLRHVANNRVYMLPRLEVNESVG